MLIASEMEPAPAAKDSRSFETVPAAESATPATAPAGEAKVFTGDPDKAPRGWYVQIQSMVSPEHAELMIDHVRSLGFNSFWKRPMLESQPKQKSKIPQWWILRLGPYPTLPAAEEEKARFLRAIEKTPLKKPKGIKWAPFVPKGENP